MLSYRHGFHAGNLADVHKHATLIYTLEYLIQKNKPLCYIDTHAGGGFYALTDTFAQKNNEFLSGIGSLWDKHDLPTILKRYVNWVKSANLDGQLSDYPGSPWFAKHILRSTDRLILFEKHTTEFANLSAKFLGDKRIKHYQEDGFTGLIRQLPPAEKRGVILIDPSYEIKSDYHTVFETFKKALQRFANGVYLIWYPILQNNPASALIQSLSKLPLKNSFLFEIQEEPAISTGMQGSGMIVINSPWTLPSEIEPALRYLSQNLLDNNNYRYVIRRLDGHE